VVEHLLAKERVESSNLFIRFTFCISTLSGFQRTFSDSNPQIGCPMLQASRPALISTKRHCCSWADSLVLRGPNRKMRLDGGRADIPTHGNF
jgi:hypothetical protein